MEVLVSKRLHQTLSTTAIGTLTALLGVAGCQGPATTAAISGSSPRYAFSAPGGPPGIGEGGLAVWITDVSDLCDAVMKGSMPPNKKGMQLMLTDLSNATQGNFLGALPSQPGVFSASMGPYLAQAGLLDETGGKCTGESSVGASSGTVDLTRIDATGSAGTFDLTFTDGTHLTGRFDAPNCADLGNVKYLEYLPCGG
jgi:hypothetical protein